jgi:hypothetical protein
VCGSFKWCGTSIENVAAAVKELLDLQGRKELPVHKVQLERTVLKELQALKVLLARKARLEQLDLLEQTEQTVQTVQQVLKV